MVENTLSGIGGGNYMFSNVNNVSNGFYGSNVSSNVNIINGVSSSNVNNINVNNNSNNNNVNINSNSNINIKSSMVLINLNNSTNTNVNNKFGLSGVSSTQFNNNSSIVGGMHFNANTNTPLNPQL